MPPLLAYVHTILVNHEVEDESEVFIHYMNCPPIRGYQVSHNYLTWLPTPIYGYITSRSNHKIINVSDYNDLLTSND